jgi:glycosyltransferase involved in cell wall biosynthesis
VKQVSIVIPVYNSTHSLFELHERINGAMLKIGKSFEIIFVDDNSKDMSWDTLLKIKEKAGEQVTIIQLKKNVGQHNAIICGFNFCSGEIIITMDDDLQHPPEEINKLIIQHEKNQADVVYGVYKDRKHGVVRATGSMMAQKSSKYFANNKKGTGSSFRLFSKAIVDRLKGHLQNFIYIDEIIHWYTGNIEAVEVEHHARAEGKSSYNLIKLTRMYFSVLINFVAWPLKAITFMGVSFSIISFVIGVLYIIKKVFFNVDVPGFTAIIVLLCFSTSLMLMSLGIIGQYLYKIYHQQNGKPPYYINTVI